MNQEEVKPGHIFKSKHKIIGMNEKYKILISIVPRITFLKNVKMHIIVFVVNDRKIGNI